MPEMNTSLYLHLTFAQHVLLHGNIKKDEDYHMYVQIHIYAQNVLANKIRFK